MAIEIFENKPIKKRRKKNFITFSILASIIFSTILFYTYIQNSPTISSELPTIKIMTEENPNYGSYINCTFQLSTSDGTEEFKPLNSKIRVRGSGTGWNAFSPKKGYRIKLSTDKSLLNLRKDDDWLLIQLTDQKRGWVRKNTVAEIQE